MLFTSQRSAVCITEGLETFMTLCKLGIRATFPGHVDFPQPATSIASAEQSLLPLKQAGTVL
jgi:hypothetical protein